MPVLPGDFPGGYPLPPTPDAPRICVQLEIPNEPTHIANFIGALLTLTIWKNYRAEADRRNKPVADVWRDIVYGIQFGNCQPTIVGGGGAEAEDNLIRQNPDNPCELQTSIDGITWCTFADLSLCFGAPPQPGPGTPQPGPGGECATYHGVIGARGAWYVPTVVNTGDTIELVSATGAWHDGSETAWRCFDGGLFFAGANTGIKTTNGGDPLPAVSHMAMIVNIAGTFYDLTAGPVTVGAGVSNGQMYIQPNDADLSNNDGTLTFDVKVCNNQPEPVNRNDNFQTQTFGWVPLVAGGGLENGVWIPGSGFGDTLHLASGFDFRAAGCMINLPAFTLTDFVVKYNLTQGSNASGGSPGIFILYNSDTILTSVPWNARVDGDNQTIEWHGSQPGVTHLGVFVGASNVSGSGDGGGSALITSAFVQGS